MPRPTEFDDTLQRLESHLHKLEAEYTLYFAGRQPRPPLVLRRQVEREVRRIDREHIPNYANRFRFSTLQARYMALADLWDRAMRAREEGRPGPFTPGPAGPGQARPTDRPMSIGEPHSVTLTDPNEEIDKVCVLYDDLVLAQHAAGRATVSFARFAEQVREQMSLAREQGRTVVEFRVETVEGDARLLAQAKPRPEMERPESGGQRDH